MPADRPRVVLLRGHSANLWDLRPWEQLLERYDVTVLVTGANVHDLAGLRIGVQPVASVRDPFPAGRAGSAAAYALGERYRGLAEHLRGAAIVHSAEIGTWFSAQAAALRAALGFRLVLTVWETIPWLDAWRWPRERAYRRRTLPATDRFLPATERAARTLRLEGAAADRITVCPPGIDTARFAGAGCAAAAREHLVLSAGRLVWEKGHQDVLRAAAAVALGHDGGDPAPTLRVLVIGSGPEEKRLRRHAAELGIADRVEFRAAVPYDEMPGMYARASCLVLASLARPGWEEQFGMVLVEAMSAGLPVITTNSGAIPEVVGGDPAELIGPGDWPGLARALRESVLSRPPGRRVDWPAERLVRFSTGAAARRVGGVYDTLLAG
jgi:glycosyltransferase involved in cell wall biosynthesis